MLCQKSCDVEIFKEENVLCCINIKEYPLQLWFPLCVFSFCQIGIIFSFIGIYSKINIPREPHINEQMYYAFSMDEVTKSNIYWR